MNQSYGWVMSRPQITLHLEQFVRAVYRVSCHIWMSHVTYEWAMSPMNISHVTRTDRITPRAVRAGRISVCHVTYEWVMSPTNEPYHVWIWVMSQTQIASRPEQFARAVPVLASLLEKEHAGFFLRVPWPIHTCDVTHSYVWHVCSYVWHDSFRGSGMMRSCVWHASFISVTGLIHMCDVPHSYGY